MNEASVEEWLRLNPQATDRILSRLKFEGDPLPRPSVSSGSIDQLRVSATSPDAFEQAAKRHRASFSDTLRTSDLFKEIAKSIYSSFDLSDIVSKVLSIAVTLVHAERCIVFLKDEAADELYSTAWGVGREPQLSASYISFDNNVSPNGVSRSDMLDVVVTRDLSKMGESSEDMFNKWEAGKPQPLQDPGIRFKIGSGIAGYVAKTGVAVNLENAYSDPRFDREFDVKTGCKTQSLLCLPIFAAGNERKILGVASLVNKVSFNHTGQQPDGEHYSFTKFSDEDESIFKDFLFLVGIAINNSFLFQQLREKEQMALAEMRKVKVLLNVAKSLYHEDNTVDLCRKIIIHARDLANADRASCFFVDKEASLLYSAIFDSGTGKKIAMPLNKGIAGYVATTGQPVNLTDAYNDPRFNDEVDRATGYKTTSLLCVPIMGPGSDVVGVTNLINKKNSNSQVVPFTRSDEEILEAFSSFCGICIHKTLLLEEIKKSRMQVEVALELMSYHAAAKPEDLQNFQLLQLERVSLEKLQHPDFDPHDFDPTDDRLVWLAFDMFNQLGFLTKFEIPEQKFLIYILTVRKNYRNVAYHNFTHAVSVLHGIYILLCRNIYEPFGITPLEAFAMAVAALNHDIDHRGTNNQFQKTAQTALANFYSTSVMERHHFNHAMTILNSPGHNILDQLDASEYKLSLELIEHAILATDLALYFKNKSKVIELSDGRYDSSIKEHRDLLRGITMTCADLSAMFKPWEKAKHIANSVYAEFFEQGDEEKKLGLPYSSDVMNRENEAQIPKLQVEFYDVIVTPAFETLNVVLANRAEFIVERVKDNHANWKLLRDTTGEYKIKL